MASSKVQVICEDGYPLGATLYQPPSDITLKGAVLIGPATGIKQAFYGAFAQHISRQGYAVLTFDNRGIGASRQGALKGFDASLQDWGELDLTACLAYLQQQFPDTRYHLIGHSAGGQLIGLMDNAHALSSLFNFACSSGKLSNMAWSFRIQGRFFMDVFIPATNAVLGYTPCQWVGMGQPLPKRVSQQWADWCNTGGYVEAAFGKTVHQHHYDELDMPSTWLYATDDHIATHDNVLDMVRVFKKFKPEIVKLDPDELGGEPIGHMLFFRPVHKALWARAVEWLDRHSGS